MRTAVFNALLDRSVEAFQLRRIDLKFRDAYVRLPGVHVVLATAVEVTASPDKIGAIPGRIAVAENGNVCDAV
jgi:hypothetical protein